ncbi:MAG: hypothetical protein IJY06_05230 [Oscillospiraceae bacterium]|nr:hypothetical protein [Oscillospiraceae bacterium]
MKKFVCCILTAVLFMLLHPPTVCAQESPPTYDESLSALLESSGTDALLSESSVGELLGEQGISPDEPESVTALSFTGFLESLAEQAADAAAEPLRVFGLLLGVILLSAFAESLQSSRSSAGEIYEMICVLCAVGVMAKPVSTAFLEASAHLEASADFMLRFSAIFGAVLTVCGGLTTAAAYQAAMLAVCEIVMQISVHVMLPVLSMVLAMSIVDAVNPAVSLQGMVKLFHKCIIWLLGLLMSVFLGMLSIQSMVTASADRASSKTTKFVLSNSIPFVGGAVSDAYATVLGSMGVLKTTTGVVGILSVLSLLLPVLLQLGISRFLIAAAAAVGELFGVQRVTRLLRNTESVLAAAFSVSVSFSVIFIVSTAMMLMLGGHLTAV